MEQHLLEIKKILERFIQKYHLNRYYLAINDTITHDTVNYLNLKCHDAFDSYTGKEMKQILLDIYEEIRTYLKENDIKDALYIITSKWGVELYFKVSITF